MVYDLTGVGRMEEMPFAKVFTEYFNTKCTISHQTECFFESKLSGH